MGVRMHLCIHATKSSHTLCEIRPSHRRAPGRAYIVFKRPGEQDEVSEIMNKRYAARTKRGPACKEKEQIAKDNTGTLSFLWRSTLPFCENDEDYVGRSGCGIEPQSVIVPRRLGRTRTGCQNTQDFAGSANAETNACPILYIF